MPIIHSKTQEVNKSSQQVFDFLSDFHNFKALLPADKIENWQCTSDSCSFTVVGIITLQLTIKEKKPFTEINYQSNPEAKYQFNLNVLIAELNANRCNCTISMDYHLNPILNSMAQKPLMGLINMMVEKIESSDFKSQI